MLRAFLAVVATLGLAFVGGCDLLDSATEGGGSGGIGGIGGGGSGGGGGGGTGGGGEVTCIEPTTDSFIGGCEVPGGCFELYAPVDPAAFADYCVEDCGGSTADDCSAHTSAGAVCVQAYEADGTPFTWVYFLDGTTEDVVAYCNQDEMVCAEVFYFE